MTRGRVRRAWLGIAGMRVAVIPEVAAKLGSRTGMQVAEVSPGSPAAEAGLRRGDAVVSLDGNPVITATAVQRLMVEDAIDRRIEITVRRNGALVDVLAYPHELSRPERPARTLVDVLAYPRELLTPWASPPARTLVAAAPRPRPGRGRPSSSLRSTTGYAPSGLSTAPP